MNILKGDPSHPQIMPLLAEHLEDMAQHSPKESIHALDVSGLMSADITFWAVWEDNEVLGCGALKALSHCHGEIKSMRTSSAHRRKGVAHTLLSHIMEICYQRNYKKVSLETGAMEAFAPARALYSRFGFISCAPFADYKDDPYSTFMSKVLVQE